MKKNIITISTTLVLILVVVYFIARCSITMQNIIINKKYYDIYTYRLAKNISFLQIYTLISTIFCILTLATYFIFIEKFNYKNKWIKLVLKGELPFAISAIIFQIICYIVLATMPVGMPFLIVAGAILLLFNFYPGVFFIFNFFFIYNNLDQL